MYQWYMYIMYMFYMYVGLQIALTRRNRYAIANRVQAEVSQWMWRIRMSICQVHAGFCMNPILYCVQIMASKHHAYNTSIASTFGSSSARQADPTWVTFSVQSKFRVHAMWWHPCFWWLLNESMPRSDARICPLRLNWISSCDMSQPTRRTLTPLETNVITANVSQYHWLTCWPTAPTRLRWPAWDAPWWWRLW